MEDEDHVYDSNEDEYESSSDDLNELEVLSFYVQLMLILEAIL